MRLLAELKRRNVIRFAGLYLVGAWLLVQVAGALLPVFEAPAWTMKILVAGLAVLFVPALVFAWMFELTPQGLKRDADVAPEDSIAPATARRINRLMAGALLLALGYFALDKFVLDRSALPPPAAEPVASVAAETQERPSIAVLPFDNRSNVEGDRFFVDGMHDDILTQLSKIGGLKVISRTSVESFRDSKLTLKDIAAQLGVKSVLEGGVQRGGNMIRINMQLIDAASEEHLWAESYDRELSAENIFAIQSEVTQAITGALRMRLSAGEQSRLQAIPTTDIEAWEAYQLGRRRMVSRNSTDLAAAREHFARAIALDPKFTLAHVGLADVVNLQTTYSGLDFAAGQTLAKASVETALRLDPDSAEAWTSSASLAQNDNDIAEAERRFRKAIELNPNYATAYHWYGLLLQNESRFDEALVAIGKALELDPLAPTINSVLSGLYLLNGEREKALARARKVVELEPDSAHGYGNLAWMLGYTFNRFSEAPPLFETAYRLDPDSPNSLVDPAWVLYDLGDREGSRRLLDRALARHPDGAYLFNALAWIHAAEGETAVAEEYARRVSAVHPTVFGALAYLLAARGDHPAVLALFLERSPESLAPGFTLKRYTIDSSLVLAQVLQHTGDAAQAERLLAAAAAMLAGRARLDGYTSGIADIKIHALRGDKAKALAALRRAYDEGWRGPTWRAARDIDPTLASLRDDAEFKAVFAAIEQDMQGQREAIRRQPHGELFQ